MKVKSFVFYASYYEAIKELEESDRLKVYDAICEYALNHKEIELGGVAKGIMKIIKPLLDSNFQKRMANSENGRKGAEARWSKSDEESEDKGKTKAKIKPTNSETMANLWRNDSLMNNVNVNVNDNVNGNVNVNAKKTKSFKAPTLQEIEAYCIERKNNVDAKRFYDYYSSANWKDKNGNQVINWKQKMIASWETKVKQEDVKPTYDASTNTYLSDDEEQEILKLIGRA